MRRLKAGTAGIAVAALALTLAACGSDGGDTDSNTDTDTDSSTSGDLKADLTWWDTSDATNEAPAYDKLIESRFADIKNTGGRPAGSVTAASFLARFVGDTPWAHLDIAATAMGGSPSETNTSWAPGFGVALLDRLVRDNFEKA